MNHNTENTEFFYKGPLSSFTLEKNYIVPQNILEYIFSYRIMICRLPKKQSLWDMTWIWLYPEFGPKIYFKTKHLKELENKFGKDNVKGKKFYVMCGKEIPYCSDKTQHCYFFTSPKYMKPLSISL